MIKGNSYTWNQIMKFAIVGDYNRKEHGEYVCGENFIVLTNNVHTVSFVLTGVTGQESIYECIFAE